MEKVLHVDFRMYLPDVQYVFPNCCSYFFQHFSWEFLIIGIAISALLSALIQLMWVSLLSAWSSLFLFLFTCFCLCHTSVSVIWQTQNLFWYMATALLANACHVQLKFFTMKFIWMNKYQHWKLNVKGYFLTLYL